jgi:eukaryotic-like serine/threonine-protein kinase
MTAALENLVCSTRLDGRYELCELIGRGGMGQVYRAVDTRLNREVAVKLVHRASIDNIAMERMAREARTAGVLKHPNTVRVHDTGVNDEGLPFLVMELVRGASVHRLERPMSPERVAWIGAEVCAALEEAHRLGIVHRDLKPQNLMLETDGDTERIRVLDFGIARFLREGETITREGGFVGTARYTSPEQAEALEIGPQSDLYSLGVVLYELLVGRAPFDASTDAAVLYLHVHRRATAVAKLVPDVPRKLGETIDRCLRKNPWERPESATELRRMLLHYADGTEAAQAGSAPDTNDTGQNPDTATQQAENGTPGGHLSSASPDTRLTSRLAATARRRWSGALLAALAAVLAMAATIESREAAAPAETHTHVDSSRAETPVAVVPPDVPSPEISPVTSVQPTVGLGFMKTSVTHALAALTAAHVTTRALQPVTVLHASSVRISPATRSPAIPREEVTPPDVTNPGARAELTGELRSLRERAAGDRARQALRRELQIMANGAE